MNQFTLKIIAIISMLLDHISIIFLSGTILGDIFHGIGRLAFPLFCYFIVEGFLHTKDVKKYILRLVAFALISEVPFDLAFSGKINFGYQNVFFTLALSLIALYAITRIKEQGQNVVLLSALAIFILMTAAEILRSDYLFFGIMMVVCMYLFRERKLLFFLSNAIIIWMLGLNYENLTLCTLITPNLQWFAIISILLLFLYNGRRGPKAKYIFYAFYPAHLLILFLISLL